MKVIKEENPDKQKRSLTLRISEEVMKKVDEVAEKSDISRQKLIEAILEQVLSDKGFILKIKD